MADSHDGSGHPSNFRLSVAFIFPNLILREHASSLQGEAIYRRIDRSIRAWISYRRKVITFRKYRPVFANRLSSVLSTYHKPRLPYIVVLPLFFFPSFSFSLSLFVCVRISIFASRFCVSQKGVDSMTQMKLVRLGTGPRTCRLFTILRYFPRAVIFEIAENKRRENHRRGSRVPHTRVQFAYPRARVRVRIKFRAEKWISSHLRDT